MELWDDDGQRGSEGWMTLQRPGDKMPIDQMFTYCVPETEVHCDSKKKVGKDTSN